MPLTLAQRRGINGRTLLERFQTDPATANAGGPPSSLGPGRDESEKLEKLLAAIEGTIHKSGDDARAKVNQILGLIGEAIGKAAPKLVAPTPKRTPAKSETAAVESLSPWHPSRRKSAKPKASKPTATKPVAVSRDILETKGTKSARRRPSLLALRNNS